MTGPQQGPQALLGVTDGAGVFQQYVDRLVEFQPAGVGELKRIDGDGRGIRSDVVFRHTVLHRSERVTH